MIYLNSLGPLNDYFCISNGGADTIPLSVSPRREQGFVLCRVEERPRKILNKISELRQVVYTYDRQEPLFIIIYVAKSCICVNGGRVPVPIPSPHLHRFTAIVQ